MDGPRARVAATGPNEDTALGAPPAYERERFELSKEEEDNDEHDDEEAPPWAHFDGDEKVRKGALSAARISEAFHLVDKNGNGVLTRIEVIKALRTHASVRDLLDLGHIVRQEDGTRDAATHRRCRGGRRTRVRTPDSAHSRSG